MKKAIVFLFSLYSVVIANGFAIAGQSSLSSPQNVVVAGVFVNENNALSYSVQFKGVTVIEPSVLGITVDRINLGRDVTLGEPVKTLKKEQY